MGGRPRKERWEGGPGVSGRRLLYKGRAGGRCWSIRDLPCQLIQWPLLGWEHVPEVRTDAPHCTSPQGQ